jgi:signal transduction histidine kinase/serine/threonine protein kinase
MIDITTEIAGCQITEKIYAGSRTLVYKGIDLQNSASVVIKLMRNEYPNFGEIVQFKNQYTITKNLELAGVVKPLKLETYQNRYVILMEDFGGISLKEYAQQYFQGVLPLNEFFPIAIKIASIIDSVHHLKIIHKDIKPENILINPKSQEIKVTDFGIASQLQKETQTLKSPSVLEGTLAYISPEQTGRMNRGIDYRSDFYSLGITFYELLTGRLPFSSKDAMELVHCHIAKQPIPVDEINSNIPDVLTKIVSKLMAKNAEDRYQSLLGLRYDLEKCVNELKNNNFIDNFSIGSRDASDNFIIPEKLYGREKEVETILQVFNRVARASENNYQTELILVAGISGIGKTAIVNEIHKPILSHRGYFTKGKFDQFQRNVPLSAFVQVFRDLIGQLLSESDTRVAEWKDKILDAIGNEGQLIIEVIPELEFIIGKQPSVMDLPDNAAQNRFNLLFENFLKVFATEKHPLVIFIDDLQWADLTSLQLIKLLINSQKQGCLLLIGAYRDSEVYPGHPFISMLEEIKKTEIKINIITLTPLNQSDVNNLVADTLNYTTDYVKNNQKKMHFWAKHAPENCLHKWYMVEAEICRVLSQKNQAIEYYDCAINLAKENKYLQEEALACELAAKFYLEWNKKTIARSYILDAYQKYQLWGAKAKVLHLEENYPQLLSSSIPSCSINSSFSLTGSTSTESLDLSSILKASQTLAQEIKLDILLAKMMKIVIENAGAERGYLMLNYDNEWKIVTSGEVEKVNVTLNNPILLTNESNGIPILPDAIINYVIRTKDNLVLNDARYENNFTKDAYISYFQPKSVLCFPLLNQGKLIGIIYLENNLVNGAFTPGRLKILRLLSTQAAISIENATIYNTLEIKVQERTQELSQTLTKLQETQSQLVQSEKMSALGQMVAGVAHEINNPANFIHGNLNYVKEYTQDLVQLLQAYQEYCPNPPKNIQELLREIDIEFLSADLSKILSSMKTGTQRIREIVLSLRNFSRLDEAEFKVADIHEGLDNTLMLLQHRLDESKIEIIKEYNTIPLIECYAAQLNQVFFSLLTNAIDAIEESKQTNQSEIFTIWIYTQLVENTITISIADNGIGIQENIISKIFDPFFTTKPVGKGAGLGLSISYQTVVGKHNGNLWCDSTHGLGSKFVIEIPIKTALS